MQGWRSEGDISKMTMPFQGSSHTHTDDKDGIFVGLTCGHSMHIQIVSTFWELFLRNRSKQPCTYWHSWSSTVVV